MHASTYSCIVGCALSRYCQIGNVVPVNVSRALGYALGLAIQKLSSNEQLLALPKKFPFLLIMNWLMFASVL